MSTDGALSGRLSDPLSHHNLAAWMQAGIADALDTMPRLQDSSDLAPTLAAMANAQGGRVLIGISGAEILGVIDPHETVEMALSAALALEPPLITPMPEAIHTDGKTVIVMEVPAGMPYIYMCRGQYLTRMDGHNVPLRPSELHRLLIEREEVSFETEPARNASLDDLDWEKVYEYTRRLRVPDSEAKQLLFKRGCLAKHGDGFRPTNAGILLFGKDPHPHLRGAEITAVRFAGDTMSDTFSRQDITGTLPDQIRRAETFLIDHLRRGVRLKNTMARQEQFEYPMEAAREVVVNAVAHRDYSIHGDGIRLFLFKDRMEVNSPGKLPGPVTVENIKDERFSRNPAIVQVLSDMGFIERLGYGIDRMIDLMHQHDLREPEFTETASGFRVKLYNASSDEDVTEECENDDQIFIEYGGTPINIRQEAALNYLNQGNTRITNSELQRMFPDVHPETIRRDLADLVTKDILHKLGQKRGSYYVMKQYADRFNENDD